MRRVSQLARTLETKQPFWDSSDRLQKTTYCLCLLFYYNALFKHALTLENWKKEFSAEHHKHLLSCPRVTDCIELDRRERS